jgi:hypothetical protein
MASLRKKKPTDAPVAKNDADPPEVAISAASDTPPTPEPSEQTPKAAAADDASEALKRQIDALNQAQTRGQQEAIAQLAANERRQAWLASTPGAKERVSQLGAIHHAALQAGLADTSPEYFSFLESQLAMLEHPTEAAAQMAQEMQRVARAQEPPAELKRSPVYSAPVSRDVPSVGSGRREISGRVTLTPAEQEMARVAGVTIEEYARQKRKLAQMRASGEYGEERR